MKPPLKPQKKPSGPKSTPDTSWNNVATWYDQLLEGEGTYQKELILPNLLRLMDQRIAGRTNAAHPPKILDLACGQGFFAREFAKTGATVVGVDASRALIDIAKKQAPRGVEFRMAKADALPFIKNNTIDVVTIVLALQNIENVGVTLQEAARVLARGGMLHIVLNHPAFRIPKASSWGWDEKEKTQYRRIDRYLSEIKAPIEMHPGSKSSERTLSFHRPLQFYFKALHKAGFCVIGMEEWNSHKTSEPGPRADGENLARREIPLFMHILCTDYSAQGH